MTLPRILLLAALSVAGGCAESVDERPATFEYIVNAVLAPSCGTASCHNSMTRREDLAFDTLEGAEEAFRTLPLDGCGVPGDPCEPARSQLLSVVTTGEPRMPIDSPLPDADIALIERWIIDGAVRPVKAALLAVAALAASATAASAYPQFQVSREQTCSSCHLSPDGGGLLAEYGEMTAEDDAKWGGDARFLHGKVELPEWLHVGGDVRAAAGASNPGAGVEVAAFPMQIEMHAAATKGALSLFVDGGFTLPQEGGSPLTALMSREHYVLWKQHDTGEGWFARAGRFLPVYGLRFAEHTLYTRRYGGTPLFSEVYGAGVGWTSPGAEVHLTGFVHDRLRPDVEQGDGVAAYAEKRFGQRALGVEARYTHATEKSRFEGGVTAKWWLAGSEVLVSAEVQGVHESLDAGAAGNAKRDAVVGNLIATWFAMRSVFVDVALGHYDENVKVPDVDRDAAEVNVHWFPHSHFELILMGRLQMIGFGKGGDNSGYGLLQLHYRI